MNRIIICMIIIFTFIVSSTMYSTTYHFPLGPSYSHSNFTSAFGSRNLGSGEYPNTGYNYDFHAAIDIGAPIGTNVYPIINGTVEKKFDTNDDNERIYIKYNDGGDDFIVCYFHVEIASGMNEGIPVTGGTTVVATVRDYSGADHLDVRLFLVDDYDEIDAETWSNADNPGYVLCDDIDEFDDSPFMMDENQNYLFDYNTINVSEDNSTVHFNQIGKYFEVGARVRRDEVDMDWIQVSLDGWDEDNNTYYTETQILRYPEIMDERYKVDYSLQINCGDKVTSNDDVGHNSKSVGIYPKILNPTETYHDVYFRWYVDEQIWNLLENCTLTVGVQDWYGDIKELPAVYVYGIDIPTSSSEGAVTFNPPPGTYNINEGERFQVTMSTELDGDIYFNTYGSSYINYSSCGDIYDLASDMLQWPYPDADFKCRFRNAGTYSLKAGVYFPNNGSVSESVCGTWTIGVITGIEDAISIVNSPDIVFSNYLFVFNYQFIDEAPYGDYIVGNPNWTLKAFHSEGEYTVGDPHWFSDLPSGYCWERDANGNVIAEVTVAAYDNTNTYHTASKIVGISGVPNPTTSGTLQEDEFWCGDLTVTSDIIIPSGIELNLSSGANITFQNNSSLIVNGTLTIDAGTVNLDFSSPNSSEQNGIIINSGADAVIKNAIIENAWYGIYINEDDVQVENCFIHDCEYGIYLYNTDSFTGDVWIKNNSSYNNEFGIVMYGSSPYLLGNNCYGNYIGVGCADYSSPYLGYSGVNGNNNFHNNDIGLYCYNSSDAFLGRSTCTVSGGNNKLENNNDYEVYSHTNCTILAENNWWGSSSPSAGQFIMTSGSTIDYDPWLTSSPFAPFVLLDEEKSPDEKLFDEEIGNTLTATNVSSKEYNFNPEWPVFWKLLYARNLIEVKDYEFAYSITKQVIDENPESEFVYYALTLMNKAGRKLSINTLSADFQKFSNTKQYKKVHAVAELQSLKFGGIDKFKKIDKMLGKYKDADIEKASLFHKFLISYHEFKNMDAAKSISAQLDKLYPESDASIAARTHLGMETSKILPKKQAVEYKTDGLPNDFVLFGNYPNPFNPSTSIKYAVPVDAEVEITIYNSMGKEVYTFEKSVHSGGYHQVQWNGVNKSGYKVSSGVYLCKIQATSLESQSETFVDFAKLMLLK